MKTYKIAVDGPAGSGKSTIAKLIAKELGIIYLDTGAMYRSFTFKALNSSIELDDTEGLKTLLEGTLVKFDGHDIYIDGQCVSEEIRSDAVTNSVSQIAALGFVRDFMVAEQQKIATENSVIMDGRDIGTKVMPHAKYKFFLVASIEERGRRRYLELKKKGVAVELETVIKEIAIRDDKDSSRAHSPLVQAEDALLLDTTTLSIGEVVEVIVNKVRE